MTARTWLPGGAPALVVAIILLGAGTGFAQYNTAEIAGVVRDAQGGVLPGVIVIVTNEASGLRIERTSDAEGRFLFPALPVGEYTISAELSGFRHFNNKGIVLNVGQKIELPVVMQLGELTDTITVTAAAPLLRTANAEISEIID